MNRGKITQKVFIPAVEPAEYHDESRQGEAYNPASESAAPRLGTGKRAFIETYGCQMNFSDTEIIASMLNELGYGFTTEEKDADLILLNSCSIRENAEQKVWNRFADLRKLKRQKPGTVVGLMGCMAERLKHKLLEQEKLVDLVVGPDAYRDLPRLLSEAESGQKAVNVILSREETYADISPIRLNSNGVTAFISIMRGCDNMCSFCVVPFTRGRERSRDAASIVEEARTLVAEGYKEVTLLGQNVDSYKEEGCNFAQLLERVALVSPDLRVRFSTSHPKDITDEVLHVIAKHPNICNYIHLPAQSGNSRVLELMKRGYTREWYLDKVRRIREVVPDCAISTDVITGFCGETEEEHQDTLTLLHQSRFVYAFMFHYSERPGTNAAKNLTDDVPLEVKKRRLNDVIVVQSKVSTDLLRDWVGKECTVLVEGNSKKSEHDWCGRNDQNMMVVFPKKADTAGPGSYVKVRIVDATSATLKGEALS